MNEELRQRLIFNTFKKAFSNFLAGVCVRVQNHFKKDYTERAVVLTIHDIWTDSDMNLVHFASKEADYVFDLLLNYTDNLNDYEDQATKEN